MTKRVFNLFLGAFIALAAVTILGLGSARADDPTFILIIKDHKFAPTQIEVPANTKVRLIVKNQDSTPEEFESTELRREKIIPGGTEGIVFIGPLRPGTYEFFGDFNPATARGHIVVK